MIDQKTYMNGVNDAYFRGFNDGVYSANYVGSAKTEIVWVKPNPKKHATAVKFRDGGIVVVKVSETDKEGDIYQAVAYAVAERAYGSNSAFKKAVDKAVQMKVINVRPSKEEIKAMKEACDRIAEEARKGK